MLSEELRDKIVARLLRQYGEYVALQGAIEAYKQEKIIGGASDELDQKIELLKNLQTQLSGEMTFATPLVWILYKARAYKNTPQAIDTFGDFRAHCSPEGYICTKRYRFMREYLQQHAVVLDTYDNSLLLEDFAKQSKIANLENDTTFMHQWQAQEYYRTKGDIAKWQK